MANKRIQDLEQTTDLTNDDLIPLETTKKTFATSLKSLAEWLKGTFQTTANMVNYVKKSGDTMNGTLTNTGVFVANIDAVSFIARSKTLVKGSTPTANKYVGYDWQDKNGARLVYLGVDYRTDGTKRLELQKIDTDLTGWLIQFAPVFTDIVTAQFNGNARYRCICQGYTKGTAPTTSQFGGVSTFDKNNVEVATLYSGIDTNNTITSALWVKQPTASGTAAKAISIYCDKNGVFHTSCSVQSAETNSILTTVSHSDNYVLLGNGIQIIKGSIDTNVSRTATFEHPFKDTNYVCLAQTSGGTAAETALILITPNNKTTTSVSFYSSRVSYVEYICIGYA